MHKPELAVTLIGGLLALAHLIRRPVQCKQQHGQSLQRGSLHKPTTNSDAAAIRAAESSTAATSATIKYTTRYISADCVFEQSILAVGGEHKRGNFDGLQQPVHHRPNQPERRLQCIQRQQSSAAQWPGVTPRQRHSVRHDELRDLGATELWESRQLGLGQ